jgi:hypothetical protein
MKTMKQKSSKKHTRKKNKTSKQNRSNSFASVPIATEFSKFPTTNVSGNFPLSHHSVPSRLFTAGSTQSGGDDQGNYLVNGTVGGTVKTTFISYDGANNADASTAIWTSSFESVFFENARTSIKEIIQKIKSEPPSSCKTHVKQKWMSCLSNCKKTISEFIQTEIKSTAYILHAITNSILSPNKNSNIKFSITSGAKITGKWADDKQHITISYIGDISPASTSVGGWQSAVQIPGSINSRYAKQYNNIKPVVPVPGISPVSKSKTNVNVVSPGPVVSTNTTQLALSTSSTIMQQTNASNISGASRLIMGFGPSASGKTYWAKSIIEIMREMNPGFPETFITIDGGIYRERSRIYQIIVEELQAAEQSGFDNLVIPGAPILEKVGQVVTSLVTTLATPKSLFESDIIKKYITEFLETQKDKIKISLYVPETLGFCGGDCSKKYKKYKSITKDENWVGLLIWQHKTGIECDYESAYACVGCTESGKQREQSEGKKYSNDTWTNSYINGENELFKHAKSSDKHIIYNIHNSGGKKYYDGVTKSEHKCKSIIKYYTESAKPADRLITKFADETSNIYCEFIKCDLPK